MQSYEKILQGLSGYFSFSGRPGAHVLASRVASLSFAPRRNHAAPAGLSAQMHGRPALALRAWRTWLPTGRPAARQAYGAPPAHNRSHPWRKSSFEFLVLSFELIFIEANVLTGRGFDTLLTAFAAFSRRPFPRGINRADTSIKIVAERDRRARGARGRPKG